MKFRNDLTAEYVRSMVNYDPETGSVTWTQQSARDVRKSGRGRARPVAGSVATTLKSSGYLVVRFNRVSYQAHRIAWLWMMGEWPPVLVDHRDRDRTNNAWANLRPATHSQNRSNSGVWSNNLLGVKGVNLLPTGQYRAVINYGGKSHHLGRFDTIEEAHARYVKEALRQFGEFARAA